LFPRHHNSGSHNYAPQHLNEAVSFLSDHTATNYPSTSSITVANDFMASSTRTQSGRTPLPFHVLVSQPYGTKVLPSFLPFLCFILHCLYCFGLIALRDIAPAIEEAHRHTWPRVSVHFN
jgi:hypothetical protein